MSIAGQMLMGIPCLTYRRLPDYREHFAHKYRYLCPKAGMHRYLPQERENF